MMSRRRCCQKSATVSSETYCSRTTTRTNTLQTGYHRGSSYFIMLILVSLLGLEMILTITTTTPTKSASSIFPTIMFADAFSIVPSRSLLSVRSPSRKTKYNQNQKYQPQQDDLIMNKFSATSDDNSSNDDDGGDFLTIATTQGMGESDEIRQALTNHDMTAMLGLELKFVEVPCVETSKDNDDDDDDAVVLNSNLLDDIDIACFQSELAVENWLDQVDVAQGISSTEKDEMSDEEKQALGNGGVVAVCVSTETANICLQSKRWESRNIYYPNINKSGMREGDTDKTEIDKWADSAVQAFGDVMERKFWGGGW
mmetsp:Transcript_8133/g.11719  ORF Transcript_8133/g.11719 Transcript_8133/m.11719 type:complete len:313 (-) Transcript_8133:70-1008(-)